MARRVRTMADFPPEFMDAWRLACEGKLMLSFDSIGQARNMIQRLYTFRKRVAEEAPQIGAAFYLVDLRIHDEQGNVIVAKQTAVPTKAIIRPFKPGWKDQIQSQMSGLAHVSVPGGALQAGELPVPVVPPESGANTPHVPSESSDSMGEALSNLGYGVDKP